MTIQLRQICLVAEHLAPVIDDLTTILGINSCYVDPGVGIFGLENNLMAVGRNFLEVVAPTQPNTAGGRYLERRGGDGGYMVITKIDTFENQQILYITLTLLIFTFAFKSIFLTILNFRQKKPPNGDF